MAHPSLTDAALALGLTLVGLLLGQENPTGQWRHFDWPAVVLTTLATLPIIVRRRAPTIVLLVCCVFWTVYIAAGYWPVVGVNGVLLALYSVAAARPARTAALGAMLVASVWIYAGIKGHQGSMVSVVAQSIVIPAVLWKFGDNAKQLDARNRQLARAAEQLRLGQEHRARRAVVEERLRIARELHDVVAHHMSVISIQAGLARYVLRSDPDTANVALDAVLDAGGEAQHEMRRLLAVLRVGSRPTGSDAEPYDPAPGVADLPELIDRVRAAGVDVDVVVTGTSRVLSPGVELCAYRVIQECLTNVLKHAAPATATVTLHYGTETLTATVSDNGSRAGRATAETTGGQGLTGMRERARLYGGTLTAAVRPEHGFEVTLVLPTAVAASAEPTVDPTVTLL